MQMFLARPRLGEHSGPVGLLPCRTHLVTHIDNVLIRPEEDDCSRGNDGSTNDEHCSDNIRQHQTVICHPQLSRMRRNILLLDEYLNSSAVTAIVSGLDR